MQSKSLFDVNTFLETTHAGKLSTEFVLPDPGDYLAQVTDKMDAVSGIIGADKQRGGEPWASLLLQWELMDDSVRAKMNMEHVIVRQSIMLDLVPGTGINGVPPQLDFGVNKNMRLRRVYDAVGVLKNAKINPGMLKFQSALVHVEHRADPNDAEIIYAEVTRVTSPDKARMREAAQ